MSNRGRNRRHWFKHGLRFTPVTSSKPPGAASIAALMAIEQLTRPVLAMPIKMKDEAGDLYRAAAHGLPKGAMERLHVEAAVV
jgi:hypothetical protein